MTMFDELQVWQVAIVLTLHVIVYTFLQVKAWDY